MIREFRLNTRWRKGGYIFLNDIDLGYIFRGGDFIKYSEV